MHKCGFTAALSISQPSLGLKNVTLAPALSAQLRCLKKGGFRFEVKIPGGSGHSLPSQGFGKFEYTDELSSNLKLYVQKSPFGFEIRNVYTNDVIFGTMNALVPWEYAADSSYFSIPTYIPDFSYLFGFGDRNNDPLLNEKTPYRIWSYPAPKGCLPGLESCYSAHPVIHVLSKDGFGRVYYQRNSHGMQGRHLPSKNAFVFEALGGDFDLVFFSGAMDDAISHYTDFISEGQNLLPPMFMLGFGQARWGWDSTDAVRDLVRGYRGADIPFDHVWFDIDYMSEYKDFTFGPTFTDMPKLARELRDEDVHLVLIVDPGLAADDKYDFYTDSLASGGLIADPDTGKPYVGSCWSGNKTVWPMFGADEPFQPVWKKYLSALVPYVSGFWIDMNDPSNFATKSNLIKDCKGVDKVTPACPAFMLPGLVSLDQSTIPMHTETTKGRFDHVHNLYGHYESEGTRTAVESITDRRFVITTRAHFSGSGKFAYSWLGDNFLTYHDLEKSISRHFMAQVNGVRMTGPDIGGFFGSMDTPGKTTLVARWLQLSSFYTMSRMHKAKMFDFIPPYEVPLFTSVAKRAVLFKYDLYPLIYSQLYHGEPLFSLMYTRFPQMYKVFDQLIYANNLIVCPIVSESSKRKCSLPALKGGNLIWFDFYTGSNVGGGDLTIFNDVEDLPAAYMPSGSIMLLRNMTEFTQKNQVHTIRDTIKAPFIIRGAALPLNNGAAGTSLGEGVFRVVLDAAEKTIEKEKVQGYINVGQNDLSVVMKQCDGPFSGNYVDRIEIAGVPFAIHVMVNYKDYSTFTHNDDGFLTIYLHEMRLCDISHVSWH
ncbi:hypothetical protein PCE1_001132 [Barthelona sp. PCE]